MAKYHTVEIAGVQRPVNFGMWALGEFEQVTGVKLATLQQEANALGITEVVHLIFFALKHGARVAKQEFPFGPHDVADFLDEDPDAAARILEVFTGSVADEKKAQATGQKKTK